MTPDASTPSGSLRTSCCSRTDPSGPLPLAFLRGLTIGAEAVAAAAEAARAVVKVTRVVRLGGGRGGGGGGGALGGFMGGASAKLGGRAAASAATPRKSSRSMRISHRALRVSTLKWIGMREVRNWGTVRMILENKQTLADAQKLRPEAHLPVTDRQLRVIVCLLAPAGLERRGRTAAVWQPLMPQAVGQVCGPGLGRQRLGVAQDASEKLHVQLGQETRA